jgi:pimeloyl-ACP methyl ester carboxylesterase
VGTTAPSTVVLVHGAWHGAWAWSRILPGLAAQGVPTVALDLPGHGDSPLPLGDLSGDAAFVVEQLGGIGGPVVLVGHSYGGAVITEAASHVPDVERLVYVAAFCLDEGESVSGIANAWPEQAALGAAIRHVDGVFALDPDLAAAALYNTCPPDEIEAAVALLGPQPPASFFQPVTTASWRGLPSTYVVCEQDRAVPPALQRHMAQRCGEVVVWDCDHSPFLSRIDDTVALLARLAAAP